MSSIKKTIAFLLLISFISCKTGLDKNYETSSKESDLKEIAEKITGDDFMLLKAYITELENSQENLESKTYQSLLYEAIEKDRLEQEKLEEAKKEEEERIKAANLKKEIVAKTTLLCNKQWKINEYAMLMRVPDDSEESIQLGTDVLNKVMFIKDAELAISIVKEDKDVFVKGSFDQKLTGLMSNNGKRTKEYFNDGTYKIIYGKDTETGTWEFVNADRIKEKRPSQSSLKTKKGIFFIDVKDLNDTTFNFTENEYNPLHYGQKINTYTYIAMSL